MGDIAYLPKITGKIIDTYKPPNHKLKLVVYVVGPVFAPQLLNQRLVAMSWLYPQDV